jgi:hypothetical protein
MNLDPTAAAYGLFHVAFADMVNHVAAALFRLRRPKEAGLTFQELLDLPFGCMLKSLQEQLNKFKGNSLLARELHDLEGACSQMREIQHWRNKRVHARVQWVADGIALYDYRTGMPLTMSREESEEKIWQVSEVIAKLEGHVPDLISVQKWDNVIDRLFETVDD